MARTVELWHFEQVFLNCGHRRQIPAIEWPLNWLKVFRREKERPGCPSGSTREERIKSREFKVWGKWIVSGYQLEVLKQIGKEEITINN